MSIFPPSKEARAERGRNVTVTFDGHVEVDQSVAMSSTTTILVTVDRGWRASASPGMFSGTGPYSGDFLISVEVPHDAEAGVVGEMVVTASALASGHDAVEASQSGGIRVSQYHGISILSHDDHDAVRRDGSGLFTCTVRNHGNGLEKVHLAAEFPEGTGAKVTPDTTRIAAWSESEVSVEVFVGEDMPAGVYTVVVTAEVLDDSGWAHSVDSVELTVEVLSWSDTVPTLWMSVVAVLAAVSVAAVAVLWRRGRPRGSRRRDGTDPGDG